MSPRPATVVVQRGRRPEQPKKRKQPEAELQKLVNRSIKTAFAGKCHIRDTNPELVRADGPAGQQQIAGSKNKGRPDIVGHIYGLHIEIELKVSTRYPTQEQKREIKKVQETGGIACLIVHHRSENKYYLVLGNDIHNFSYKIREEWIELKKFKLPDGNEVLSMESLNYLIVGHVANLIAYVSPNNPK